MATIPGLPGVGSVGARRNTDKKLQTEAKTIPLNGNRIDPLHDKKTKLQEQLDELHRQAAEITLQEQERDTKRRQDLINQRTELQTDAKQYREEARLCKDPDEKKTLYGYAADCEKAIASITAELGEEMPVVAEEKVPWYERNHRVVAILQVFGVIALTWWMKWFFDEFKNEIDQLNKALPYEKQMQPYDITSLQKFVFEKFVVFADLPIALIMLFLMVPFIGFYVLPFLKSQKDFYYEFYNELTPWQRACITTAFCLGLLFVLGLSHSVKP